MVEFLIKVLKENLVCNINIRPFYLREVYYILDYKEHICLEYSYYCRCTD